MKAEKENHVFQDSDRVQKKARKFHAKQTHLRLFYSVKQQKNMFRSCTKARSWPEVRDYIAQNISEEAKYNVIK
jgi:hypothetical protein